MPEIAPRQAASFGKGNTARAPKKANVMKKQACFSKRRGKVKEKNIAQKLEWWYEDFCRSQVLVKDFIEHDPVQFPRRFKRRADIEIAAFLTATIAWGRRDLIIRSAQKMFSLMEPCPSAFVMDGDYRKLKDRCVYRTFFEDDLKYFCRGFKSCYMKYGSLEKLFVSAPDIWQGIALFREEMAAANKGRYSKHIADPGSPDRAGSACKRINLALRWLVRKGPVDMGLWKSITPAALYIPLDIHVARTSRRLGLLERKSNDKKAVIELTEKLRKFCPEDPVKYDFVLFSMSLVDKWQ
jgi:uncharacterized protein (TIGR02757 family)